MAEVRVYTCTHCQCNISARGLIPLLGIRFRPVPQVRIPKTDPTLAPTRTQCLTSSPYPEVRNRPRIPNGFDPVGSCDRRPTGPMLTVDGRLGSDDAKNGGRGSFRTWPSG